VRRRDVQGRIEHGDWQTPEALARRVVDLVSRLGFSPVSVVEPTCGRGALLAAALEIPSLTTARGFDIDPAHIEAAQARFSGLPVELFVRDFFTIDWESELGSLPDPLLVLGNPPWVTSADLGALGSANLPTKSNFKRLTGLDAMTGKSNFDVSEWMLVRLLRALAGRDFRLVMLCKASVARRIMENLGREGSPLSGATYRIDARVYFAVSTSAVLLVVGPDISRQTQGHERSWAVFDSLDAKEPSRFMGFAYGRAYSDVSKFEATRWLEGASELSWRSGLKHDCARVMELERRGEHLINGLDEQVEVEPEYLFPLLKGSDIANHRPPGRRYVIVPQRALGADTAIVRERAPLAFAYLERHAERLAARKSSIYRGKPPFSVFGVGEYTFSPYKVAICGLYKRLEFALVEPLEGRPVVLDDTCYFLPFEDVEVAQNAIELLNGSEARSFFEGRVFWDEKRPIGKTLLDSLSLKALVHTSQGFVGVGVSPG